MTDNDFEVRKPGRPRQPYCLDCIRAGIGEIPKEPGLGYCKRHHVIRQRAYRHASDTGATMEESINFQLRAELFAADARMAELESIVERLYLERENVSKVIPIEESDSLKEVVRAYELWQKRARQHIEDPIEYPHPDAEDTRSRTEIDFQKNLDIVNAIDIFADASQEEDSL